MRHARPLACAALTAASLAACGGPEPLTFSGEVMLTLDVTSAEAATGMVDVAKAITRQAGNPFGKFMRDASFWHGKDPSRIALDEATLVLDPASRGVAGLGEVFAANVELTFVLDRPVLAASGVVAAADEAGPTSLASAFSTDSLSDAELATFVSGHFDVALRGAAASDFAGRDADASMQVTLMLTAFE